MRAHPFASLISNDDDGLPYVTHLPLHLEEREGRVRRCSGHCAKPNPHWRYLQARPRALVTFLGPHAYLSPTVYPGPAARADLELPRRALHGGGHAGRGRRRPRTRLLKKLIGDHEPAYAQQWRDLGEEFQHKMLAGIVGFELRGDALAVQAQAEPAPARSRMPTMHAAYAAGNDDERALAAWMERLGMGGRTDAAIFGMIGLLVVVAIVGVLAKKQLGAGVAPPAAGAPAARRRPARRKQQVAAVQAGGRGRDAAGPRPCPTTTK